MQPDRNLVIYNPDNSPGWWAGSDHCDLRSKKDVTALQNPLKKLLSLRGVSFAWKDESLGTGRELGVIAQEVEQVFPELVNTLTERKFVRTVGLISVIIEAIKEQQAQITELRNGSRIQ